MWELILFDLFILHSWNSCQAGIAVKMNCYFLICHSISSSLHTDALGKCIVSQGIFVTSQMLQVSMMKLWIWRHMWMPIYQRTYNMHASSGLSICITWPQTMNYTILSRIAFANICYIAWKSWASWGHLILPWKLWKWVENGLRWGNVKV